MMKKHILFYSNFCQYSKDVLGTITKKNLDNEFVKVCVDTNRFKLPPFVDRVPLVCTKSKSILTDNDISAFLDQLSDVSEGVEPFTDFYKAGNISDSFSFIDDNPDDRLTNGFLVIGQDTEIQTPDEPSFNAKINDKSLEYLMSQRDTDEKIYAPQRRM